MSAPCSLELRQRIVDAYENGEGTYEDIARRFKVGVASVSRYLRLHRYGGDLSASPMGGKRRGITEEHEAFGCTASRHTMGKALRRLGFSFKRGSSARQLPSDQMSSLPAERTLTSKGHWSLDT
jgi:transposase